MVESSKTDGAELSTENDIERQRGELEAQLLRVKLSHPMPDPKSIAAWHSQIERLEAQLKALPSPRKLPPGGIQPVRIDDMLGNLPPEVEIDGGHDHHYLPAEFREPE